MSPTHGDDGEFIEETTRDDVLGVFDVVAGPILTSADVADRLGCSRQTARRKLNELHGEGIVGKRETAGRVVYWKLDAADPNPVNPNDPFFTAFSTGSSGDEDLSERVDDVLYGEEQ